MFFLRLLQFSPVSIIPPMLHTHLHLHVALNRRTNGQRLGTFQTAMFFGNRVASEIKVFSLFLVFKGLFRAALIIRSKYQHKLTV
jgi:hypothetical protein